MPSTTSEREITEPVDLCLPNGRLNRKAIGWTRTPLHRANLQGWGRTKRWEYWGIITPTHVVGLVVSSLDYAGVHGIYLLDRATGQERTVDATVPLARDVTLPDRSGEGTARGADVGLEIVFDQTPSGTRIRAVAVGIDIDLMAPVVPGQESLGVVVPWSDRLFQYTVKDIARPVSGRIVVAGKAHEVDPARSFAVLDHGRGRWPYSITWNWAAGSGVVGGRRLGIQLGGKWTDGTGSTENALLVNGRLHKIGDDLMWDYDRDDWMRPWHIRGRRVEATLTPFHERVARSNLGIVGAETHQLFGHFSGWASTDDGATVALDGLVGWAEEARNRW
ncbi:DUF2804 domain-containing protein [Nocardioides pacificus]